MAPGVPSTACSAQVLLPGDVGGGTRGDRLVTLLGSCVSIMLTDPRRTVGVMCHYVHPGEGPDAHHARAAFAAMRTWLLARGIQPELCEAHVAGGGNLFPDLVVERDIGRANVQAALQWLDALGALLRTASVGQACFRKVSWTVGDEAPAVACHPI